MKKILYVIGLVLALTACSQQEMGEPAMNGGNPNGMFTFNPALEEPEGKKDELQTATTRVADVSHYILEIYEGDLTGTLIRQISTDGLFNASMKNKVDYVYLFWADAGETDYNVSSLNIVSQTAETAIDKVAYYTAKTVNSMNFDSNVSLKHAVAEMFFAETEGFTKTDNMLIVT